MRNDSVHADHGLEGLHGVCNQCLRVRELLAGKGMGLAGADHVAAIASTGACGLIGTGDDRAQRLATLASGVARLNCQTKSTMARLEHHLLYGGAQAFGDSMGIFFDGEWQHGHKSVGAFACNDIVPS